jgi:hypothetical protein
MLNILNELALMTQIKTAAQVDSKATAAMDFKLKRNDQGDFMIKFSIYLLEFN